MIDDPDQYAMQFDPNNIRKYSFQETLNALTAQFHAISPDETGKLESDFALSLSPSVRRALVGRYPLCLKLCDDYDDWEEPLPSHIASGYLLNEPCAIAAAIALRPVQFWEWHLVEAWSWVYRHAVEMDISVDYFEFWCQRRDPNSSHEFMTTQLPWLYRRTYQSTLESLPSTTANDDE